MTNFSFSSNSRRCTKFNSEFQCASKRVDHVYQGTTRQKFDQEASVASLNWN